MLDESPPAEVHHRRWEKARLLDRLAGRVVVDLDLRDKHFEPGGVQLTGDCAPRGSRDAMAPMVCRGDRVLETRGTWWQEQGPA